MATGVVPKIRIANDFGEPDAVRGVNFMVATILSIIIYDVLRHWCPFLFLCEFVLRNKINTQSLAVQWLISTLFRQPIKKRKPRIVKMTNYQRLALL